MLKSSANCIWNESYEKILICYNCNLNLFTISASNFGWASNFQIYWTPRSRVRTFIYPVKS